MAQQNSKTKIPLRPPEFVMRLARIGSFHQSRLSFMRTLLQRLESEKWQFERSLWEIDKNGVGQAVYQAQGPNNTYSLVAFAHDLPDSMRSDRVIATAWDATFTLFDGIPTQDDLARLAKNVPYQEAGRISDQELSLSRANRSVRLWDYVLECLANGKQPDKAEILQVGYLMRTSAVYGSSKFGSADRLTLAKRNLMSGPFCVELLSVFLTRAFVLDLVEQMAVYKGGSKAVKLEPKLRRIFGIGNSTGLGMAPYLINHPTLINNWVLAREKGLARIRSLKTLSIANIDTLNHFSRRAEICAHQANSMHPIQITKNNNLRNDLAKLNLYLAKHNFAQSRPLNQLYLWGQKNLSLEGQEQLVSLLLEPFPELIDNLAHEMASNEYKAFFIDGSMKLKELKKILNQHFAWTKKINFTKPENRARFWYVSEEKLEPRLGERFQENGAELELPLKVGYDITLLLQDLANYKEQQTLAVFLNKMPQHRHIIRRIQMAPNYPYSEIQDNLIADEMLPIHLLRCKLSFFGATQFDPKSDRWLRICMYQNAPFPHELTATSVTDWVYPPLQAVRC